MKLKYLHFSLDTDGGCSECKVLVIQDLDVVVYQYFYMMLKIISKIIVIHQMFVVFFTSCVILSSDNFTL